MGETGGSYKRLLYFILPSPEKYIADIIDMACNEAAILEFGCDEVCLLEVFVTHTQEQLQAGKTKWEEVPSTRPRRTPTKPRELCLLRAGRPRLLAPFDSL